MNFEIFTGSPAHRYRKEPLELPTGLRAGEIDVGSYIVEPGLKVSVNVAIALGRPLFLTGEPGTGKTELAYVVSSELGLGDVLKFETKSTSTAKDLFYTYDMLGRFHAAQTSQKEICCLDYITYNALGEAIIQAQPLEKVSGYLSKNFKHTGPKRSVVLIDEIDKAPRDFPNDLLNELEGMHFLVPELSKDPIKADSNMRPLVFITSNSEKHLPDAFIRRCVFYHIKFPDSVLLEKIIINRVGKYIENKQQFLKDLKNFFEYLREPGCGIQKKPATAELLDWIVALVKISKDKENPMCDNEENLLLSLSTLIKNVDDYNLAQKLLKTWSENR